MGRSILGMDGGDKFIIEWERYWLDGSDLENVGPSGNGCYGMK